VAHGRSCILTPQLDDEGNEQQKSESNPSSCIASWCCARRSCSSTATRSRTSPTVACRELRDITEGLLELVGLVGVVDAERVEVPGAAHLELDGALGPLDPHRPRVLAPRRKQEVLDLMNLLRLPRKTKHAGKAKNGSALTPAASYQCIGSKGKEASLPWCWLGWRALLTESLDNQGGGGG
jgi:hypothetical protein